MNITELDVDLLPARTTLTQTATGGSGGSGGLNGLLNGVLTNVNIISIGSVQQGADLGNGGEGGSATATGS